MMITGIVESDEARVRILVKGRRRRQQTVESVIDTGFSSTLTLPPSVIAALGLRWRTVDYCTLADGSECSFDVYDATVVWGSAERRIKVFAADAEPLIGMELLRGFELKMQVCPHGKVTIRPLQQRPRRTS